MGRYIITVCNQLTRSTQSCIPPGSLNRVPASAGGKGWNVTSAGWMQVTLCDPIWHVSSSSGVATSVSELLSVLLYFTLPTTWRKNSWHRYDMKKLRRWHPMYTHWKRLRRLQEGRLFALTTSFFSASASVIFDLTSSRRL